MKISKIFHFLYFSVLSIPLLSIPVFAIYSQNHEITGNEIVQETNKVVDFNQQIELTTYRNSSLSYSNVNGRFEITNISNNVLTNPELIRCEYFNFELDHVYFYDKQDNNYQVRFWSTNVATSFYGTEQVYRVPVQNNNVYQMYLIGTLQPNETFTFSLCVYDLTQMFGAGNEPTAQEFRNYFPLDYYPYTESENVVIENYETITYNDTDIVSQFIYSEYNFMAQYLPMYKFAPFNGIYNWLQNTFFGGAAPIVFTIFYQWFAYWLFVSLCWLIFDVLMYVPLVVHRWLDKGALE